MGRATDLEGKNDHERLARRCIEDITRFHDIWISNARTGVERTGGAPLVIGEAGAWSSLVPGHGPAEVL